VTSHTFAGYPVSGLPGYPADQFGIRPDTGYKKRPDYPAGRISGASLVLVKLKILEAYCNFSFLLPQFFAVAKTNLS
jgi:hypothetical protein